MSTGAKIFLWSVIALFIGGIVYTGFRVKTLWENVSFGDYTWKVDLSGLNLADIPAILLRGEERILPVEFGLTLKNNSSVSIPFCFFKLTFFYQGTELASTSDELASKCHSLPKNDSLVITDNISVKLTRAVAKLLSDKFISGGKPEIDYTLDLIVKFFGIPIAAGWVLKILKVKKSFAWK